MISKYNLNDTNDVQQLIANNREQIVLATNHRNPVYNKLRRCKDTDKISNLKSERDVCTKQLTKLRKEIKTANTILNDVEEIKLNIKTETNIRFVPAKQKKKKFSIGEVVNFNSIKLHYMPTIIQERRVGRMFTKSQLDECRKADFNTRKINDLPDVTNLKIDIDEPIINRVRKYFQDIKNPYIFRVGDVGVKINCSGDKNLSDSIMNIALSD